MSEGGVLDEKNQQNFIVPLFRFVCRGLRFFGLVRMDASV